MAKALKKADPASEHINRDELMKKPGFSNVAPGSPAAKPVANRVIPEAKINKVKD
jgi:hypothetical protein